jgi:hypothetical protein
MTKKNSKRVESLTKGEKKIVDEVVGQMHAYAAGDISEEQENQLRDRFGAVLEHATAGQQKIMLDAVESAWDEEQRANIGSSLDELERALAGDLDDEDPGFNE